MLSKIVRKEALQRCREWHEMANNCIVEVRVGIRCLRLDQFPFVLLYIFVSLPFHHFSKIIPIEDEE